jgi:hypothetical protein
MKVLIATAFVFSVLAHEAFGQGAQADQIKRRAKELSNQNNVRQGVPPPAQSPAKAPTAPAAKPATTSPVTNAQQGTGKILADIAGIKVGAPVTQNQKTQFMKDMGAAVRGTTKPSFPTVAKFVNELTAALAEKALGAPEQSRLAQDIEAVLNSATMPLTQFDAVIADAQAILQVGDVRRAAALVIANDLRAVGQEVRRSAR